MRPQRLLAGLTLLVACGCGQAEPTYWGWLALGASFDGQAFQVPPNHGYGYLQSWSAPVGTPVVVAIAPSVRDGPRPDQLRVEALGGARVLGQSTEAYEVEESTTQRECVASLFTACSRTARYSAHFVAVVFDEPGVARLSVVDETGTIAPEALRVVVDRPKVDWGGLDADGGLHLVDGSSRWPTVGIRGERHGQWLPASPSVTLNGVTLPGRSCMAAGCTLYSLATCPGTSRLELEISAPAAGLEPQHLSAALVVEPEFLRTHGGASASCR